jgi:hypothetical protein
VKVTNCYQQRQAIAYTQTQAFQQDMALRPPILSHQ